MPSAQHGGPPSPARRLTIYYRLEEPATPANLVPMQQPFEEARPSDYLMRLAASDLGKAYKSLAVCRNGHPTG